MTLDPSILHERMALKILIRDADEHGARLYIMLRGEDNWVVFEDVRVDVGGEIVLYDKQPKEFTDSGTVSKFPRRLEELFE